MRGPGLRSWEGMMRLGTAGVMVALGWGVAFYSAAAHASKLRMQEPSLMMARGNNPRATGKSTWQPTPAFGKQPPKAAPSNRGAPAKTPGPSFYVPKDQAKRPAAPSQPPSAFSDTRANRRLGGGVGVGNNVLGLGMSPGGHVFARLNRNSQLTMAFYTHGQEDIAMVEDSNGIKPLASLTAAMFGLGLRFFPWHDLPVFVEGMVGVRRFNVAGTFEKSGQKLEVDWQTDVYAGDIILGAQWIVPLGLTLTCGAVGMAQIIKAQGRYDKKSKVVSGEVDATLANELEREGVNRFSTFHERIFPLQFNLLVSLGWAFE